MIKQIVSNLWQLVPVIRVVLTIVFFVSESIHADLSSARRQVTAEVIQGPGVTG